MHKNPALFFLIVSIFFFLSFTFPKHSFAVSRLYQCSPAIAYAPITEIGDANCKSPSAVVDCMEPDGTTAQLANGQECADNAAFWYSGQEGITLKGTCIEKCVTTALLLICSRDSLAGCFQMDMDTCTENLNPNPAGAPTFCIEYTVVAPTPTLPPPPTPTPTPTPIAPPSCSSFATCASCIVNPSCGWGGVVVPSCQNGTSSCPASYTLWNWSSCLINECAVPTPTPTPTPVGPTATPTPTAGPTPPPAVCDTVCEFISCTQPSGQPGAWQITSTSCGVGCCSISSQTCVGPAICPVPPTPTLAPPTSTPAPTSVPACPAGTIEKTINAGFTVLPTPTPDPLNCNICLDGSSCCGFNSICQSDRYGGYNCRPPPPIVPPAASYAVTDKYLDDACISPPIQTYVAIPSSTINLYHSVDDSTPTGCSNPLTIITYEAAFNFNNFSLPIGTQIRQATLRSSATGLRQAAFLSGRVGNVGSSDFRFGPPRSPLFTRIGRFGSGKMQLVSTVFPGCFIPGYSYHRCAVGGGCNKGNYFNGVSGLASGTGDATSYVQSAVNSQTLTALSFLIRPEYWEYNSWCTGRETLFTGNFTVSSPTLTITYCEGSSSPTSTPTPTPTPILETPTPTPTPTLAPITYIISGIVFVDTNDNGAIDPGESGYGGAPIDIAGPSPTFGTTTGSGNYSFPNLLGGSYTVTLTVPPGYFATTTNPVGRFLPPSTVVNFGIKPGPTPTPTITPTPAVGTSIVSGIVFVDTNDNGAIDAGEAGFSGATVESFGPVSTSTSTNATGNYSLVNLVTGSYTITLTVPAGYTATTLNPRTSISLPPSTVVNFGIKPVVVSTPTPTPTPTDIPTPTPTRTPTPTPTSTPTPTPTPIPTYTVSGIVFVDTNLNGAKDVSETGFSGATVNASGPTPRGEITNATGNYILINLLGGSYTINLSIPPGYFPTTINPVARFLGPNTIVNFGIAPLYSISGLVFIDTNENGAIDAGETGFSGATVEATGPSTANSTTAGAGNYLIANLMSGSYSVSLSPVPAGYFTTTTHPVSRTLGPSTVVNFGIAAMHSISGNVYVDSNNSKIKDGTEVNYTLGTSTVQVRSGGSCSGSLVTTINTPNGAFDTGNILTTGPYTLCYMNIPLGYVMTFPLGQIGVPHIVLDVGFPCNGFTFDSVTVGSCDAAGNITNANFGINFANPWFSSRGVDLRVDSGFDDLDIPASAIPPYASLDGTGGMPGVIFSGNENADFGPFGQASSRRWIVGSFSFPELYTSPILNTIKTSYSYFLALTQKSSLVPLSISAACGGNISNCTLNLPNDPGLFIANGNLNIVNPSPYTIPSNQDYVILVDGDLTLGAELHVPIGSTLTFSVKGDIIVDATVGSPASSATPDLEGLYSADGDFITGGNDDCAIGADLRLNIAGTIVTNAALSGGSLIKQRDLCAGNVSNPAVFITERPDFVLNSPLLIQSTQTIWQEVAP